MLGLKLNHVSKRGHWSEWLHNISQQVQVSCSVTLWLSPTSFGLGTNTSSLLYFQQTVRLWTNCVNFIFLIHHSASINQYVRPICSNKNVSNDIRKLLTWASRHVCRYFSVLPHLHVPHKLQLHLPGANEVNGKYLLRWNKFDSRGCGVRSGVGALLR